MRDMLLTHPHAVTIFATRPVRSPAATDTGNRMIELMTEAGFSLGDALRVLRCLWRRGTRAAREVEAVNAYEVMTCDTVDLKALDAFKKAWFGDPRSRPAE